MFKGLRTKVLIGAGALGLLAISGAGVAMAQTNSATSTANFYAPSAASSNATSTPATAYRQQVVDKAAQILNIDPTTLANALKTANQEVAQTQLDTAITNRLNQAVQNGILTQAQADQVTTWWQSRPTDLTPRIIAMVLAPRLNAEPPLSNLVQNGTLTQAQADAITQWWNARPSFLAHPETLLPRLGGPQGGPQGGPHGPQMGRGFGRGFSFGHGHGPMNPPADQDQAPQQGGSAS